MANIAGALNEHIRRLARREIRANIKTTKKLTAKYRRDIAALKRQITSLVRSVAFMEKQEKRRGGPASVTVVSPEQKLRFRADGLKVHRAKLGLSAADYGKLVGVSGLTIYHWESKKAKPRRSQLPKVAAVRGLGKREALKRLEMIGE